MRVGDVQQRKRCRRPDLDVRIAKRKSVEIAAAGKGGRIIGERRLRRRRDKSADSAQKPPSVHPSTSSIMNRTELAVGIKPPNRFRGKSRLLGKRKPNWQLCRKTEMRQLDLENRRRVLEIRRMQDTKREID